MTGTLHLVGVGPGDPELLTLKAARVIAASPVVAYPVANGEGALALSIAEAHVALNAVRLPVTIPMSTDPASASAAYDAAAAAIRAHLDTGRDVAWLCEGDPLFYGSAMYLIDRIGRADIVVVPGITSLTATAAAIARPLAARNETLKVLPAPLPDDQLRPELETADSVAIIKVGRHFDRIRALLVTTGLAQTATLIEYATTDRQRVTALDALGAGDRPYFSVILAHRGEAAAGMSQ